MTEISDNGVFEEVPSPFCGVGTDDLAIKVVGKVVKVIKNGCRVNTPAFEQPIGDIRPRVEGKKVSLKVAIDRAANLLRKAQLPLFGGLATDVNGMRETLALADRTGAIVDNMNFEKALRNFRVVHDSGWINTTLAEVKNRCDLLVVVGCDIEALFPRFFERYLWTEDCMFLDDPGHRTVVYLGKGPSGSASKSPSGKPAKVLACPNADLPEVLAVLRALVKGNSLDITGVGGISVGELQRLAMQLKKARYGVVTWAAGAMEFSNADLTVETICQMIKELNVTTRCSGLPLGGKNGDQTSYQVAGWQTGFPSRIDFSAGFPEYDPYLNSIESRLADGSGDLLLWVSAFDAEATPPTTRLPRIVLGRSGMKFEKEPEVFIPIGTPGIDHSGHAYRTDNVVALRLPKLRESSLPATSDILAAIEQALQET
ncbi:MAG: formylmethanofuran dehydrogenase subunit B [Methylococcus sp.]|nr:MAG: formylmethanofuran dehydrogenase subunit B [Methylococcus sp.]